jgi:hypothetical protein
MAVIPALAHFFLRSSTGIDKKGTGSNLIQVVQQSRSVCLVGVLGSERHFDGLRLNKELNMFESVWIGLP